MHDPALPKVTRIGASPDQRSWRVSREMPSTVHRSHREKRPPAAMSRRPCRRNEPVTRPEPGVCRLIIERHSARRVRLNHAFRRIAAKIIARDSTPPMCAPAIHAHRAAAYTERDTTRRPHGRRWSATHSIYRNASAAPENLGPDRDRARLQPGTWEPVGVPATYRATSDFGRSRRRDRSPH